MRTWNDIAGEAGKWGRTPPPTFKQMLVLAEIFGERAGHPTDLVSLADAIYEGNHLGKEYFLNVAVEAWEKANAKNIPA